MLKGGRGEVRGGNGTREGVEVVEGNEAEGRQGLGH